MTEPDEPVQTVQVFTLRKLVLRDQDDEAYDTWHRRNLALRAFEEGYGLLEHPKKSKRDVEHFTDETTFEVEFRAMGVKLHV